jgi:DnaJ-class molecular chaperone
MQVIECNWCNGDGVVDYNEQVEDCPVCDGRGWERVA